MRSLRTAKTLRRIGWPHLERAVNSASTSAPAVVPGILLAAGASTRLGQPKQLVLFRGDTLLGHAARAALAGGCAPVIVVLGFEAERIEARMPKLPGLRVSRCRDWEAGMGATLKTGLRALLAGRDGGEDGPAAVLVLLCDQPGVNAPLLRELTAVRHARGAAVVACAYDGTLGPPAVFGKEVFDEILALPDGAGARAIIDRHAARGEVHVVDFPAGARDVDTPADLARLDREP